jgi:hypothetical protein
MADATYAIPSFLGGAISPFAQGRFDKPDYRVSLNVCLNSYPVEIGAWTRRPGSMYAGHTRRGQPARVIKFDFEQEDAATLELTDGKMRFRNGATLITTNDTTVVVAISTANPAVVQTADAVTWVTDDTAIFPGASTPLLENRQFLLTKVDTTHFSLRDAITGANIDGATLGALPSAATIERVHELATIYIGTSYQDVRTVQAETTDVMLCPGFAPQILSVATMPAIDTNAQFEINPAVFQDGPYLDPLLNGVQLSPSALSGLIILTLTLPAYSASKAYAKGAFVTSVGIDYISLVDENVGNTPAASPTFWSTTSAAVAINDGRGFLGTDVGRLVRLLSEPPLFNPATSYTVGQVVTYNPTGVAGASTYWSAKGTTSSIPGLDLVNWQLMPAGAAIWTWGKITALPNVIARNLVGSTSIGNMTVFSGINAPFDGIFSKGIATSAASLFSGGFSPSGVPVTVSGFVGKNYSGASAQKIQQATIYPSTDFGFGFAQFTIGGSAFSPLKFYTLNLRAKNTAPGSAADGTLLGTTSFSGTSTTITIGSSDQVTAWNYVWIELVMTCTPVGSATAYEFYIDIAQISFFSPTTSTAASAGCTVEILGPALLYAQPITTWRLGVFSNTTGWPTCGTYHEGRLWLGGAVPNRFDASVSNGIQDNRINFAPTDQYGVVAASNALSYTLNSDGVNPMFWMKPDLLGVAIGTQQGEWLVQAPTTGPIAPTNIATRRMTKHGSSNVEPVRTEHANLFVKRYGRKLLEYFADAYSGKFSAPNLADKAGHIIAAGIVELAYTEAVTPIVWGRDGNNALFGMTYRRTVISTQQGPDFYAWHPHELGSTRTVESICGGPSPGGDLDALTMVTTDGEAGVRHVEILTDTYDEETELADAWQLDSAVEPSSLTFDVTPITGAPLGGVYLHGLWHLNGETVQVFAGGLDCGDRGTGSTGFTDFLVTDGTCFVPFGDGVNAGCGRGLFTESFVTAAPRIIVGFTYNSDGQIVRPIAPADSGARNGPALGKTRRNHQYSALLSNTVGISFGGTLDATKLRPAQLRKANGNPIEPLTTYSGVHHDSLDDDYSYDGMISWRVSRPWPAVVVAISGNIQTQDR